MVLHAETTGNDTIHAFHDTLYSRPIPLYLYLLLSLQLNSNLYMHSLPTYNNSRLMKADTSFGTYSAALITNTAIDLRDRGLADIFRRSTEFQ
jgi:hypothetical protein